MVRLSATASGAIANAELGAPTASASRADETPRAVLTAHGLRVTAQRIALLRELQRSNAPASHAELSERITSCVHDRATVYRNLLALVEVGLVVRLRLGDHVWRYELPRSPAAHASHPHFVCVECGGVDCLPARAVELHGIACEVVEVQLRGRCAACSSARRGSDAV